MRFASLLTLLLLAAQWLRADDLDLHRLLLTPQRVKRLKRDRERQTDRWLAFERSVKGGTESSEHGVELAVYYAVTGDAERGKEAVVWTLAHPCEALPLSIIRQATQDLETPDQTSRLDALSCPDRDHPLAKFGVRDPTMPGDEFLLSFRPAQVEKPTWQQHIAGLALVTLDPNSRAAQFLQGWAMEDRFTLHDGPGVVYELLWADPYLPGVSYQNMPPWIYREGWLFARSDWGRDACWLHITATAREQEHCPANIFSQRATFGNLVLLPMESRCLSLPPRDPNVTILLSNLKPQTKVSYESSQDKQKAEADAAGLWRVPAGVTANVCRPK